MGDYPFWGYFAIAFTGCIGVVIAISRKPEDPNKELGMRTDDMTDLSEWNWVSVGVSIPIPDDLILTAMRMLFIEKLRVRMFLLAKTFNGGSKIRCPLSSLKEN